MPNARAVVLAALAALLPGCFDDGAEERLRQAAEDLPLPEGADAREATTACGGCWSERHATASTSAAYDNASATDLLDDLSMRLEQAGWTTVLIEAPAPHATLEWRLEATTWRYWTHCSVTDARIECFMKYRSPMAPKR